MPHTTAEFREELNRTTTDMIRNAERCLSVARAIGDRAEAVNKSVHREVLGEIQLAQIAIAVLSLNKMFDPPPRAYPTRSIPGLLQAVERDAEELVVLDRGELEAYVMRKDESVASGAAAMSDADLLRLFVRTYRREIEDPSIANALERLRTRRDKSLAHNEAMAAGDEDRLMWSDLPPVLSVAKTFPIVLGPALADFIFGADDGTYMLSRDHHMPGLQMHALLDGLGIGR